MKERQGLPDDWSILLDACHGRTPRRLRSLLVPYVARAAAFQEDDPLGTSMLRFSRLLSHGPYPRVPTHRRRGYPRRRKARYRPAGLRFGRAGFAPAGRKFPNFKSFRVLFPFRPAFPGRNHPALSRRERVVYTRDRSFKAFCGDSSELRSTTDSTHTSPCLIPSRSAILRAISSFRTRLPRYW